MTLAETETYLHGVGVEGRRLHHPGARALVTPLGARVLALDWEDGSENPVYVHPGLGGHRDHIPQRFVEGGGIGGDRLWIAPEYRYFWEGEPRMGDFSNYAPSSAMDPGVYQIVAEDDRSIAFEMTATMPGGVRMEIHREIALVVPELLLPGVCVAGIRIRQRLELQDGPEDAEAGLWSILQVPAGSCIWIPSHPNRMGLVQVVGEMGERLRETPEGLEFTITGDAFAKVGVPAPAITGRAAVWQARAGGSACLLVREFPIHPLLHYGDALVRGQVGRQAVQVFDGLGFGELETHSPCVTPRDPVCEEQTFLWALSGPADDLRRAARETFSLVLP